MKDSLQFKFALKLFSRWFCSAFCTRL